MTEDDVTQDEVITRLRNERRRALEDRIKGRHQAHSELMATKPYQDELKYLDKITHHFMVGLQGIWKMGSRSSWLVENTLLLRSVDDFVQSAITVLMAVSNGAHTPPRRELRYILELGIRALYVDQKIQNASFAERLDLLDGDARTMQLSDVVDALSVWLHGKDERDFNSAVLRIYSELCAYVHPSRHQIDERLAREALGSYIGYDTPEDLRATNKTVFRVYDILLVLLFHSLGWGLAKDLYVIVFSDLKGWKYLKGTYLRRFFKQWESEAERERRYLSPRPASHSE